MHVLDRIYNVPRRKKGNDEKGNDEKLMDNTDVPTDRWQYYFEERWTDFSTAENDHIVRCYEDGMDKCEFVGPGMDYVIYFADNTYVSRSGRRRPVRIRPVSDNEPNDGATRPKSPPKRDRRSFLAGGHRHRKSKHSVHNAAQIAINGEGDADAPQKHTPPSSPNHRRRHHGPKKWISSSTDAVSKREEEARRLALHQHASARVGAKVGFALTTPRVRFDEPGEDGDGGIPVGGLLPPLPPPGGANANNNIGLPPSSPSPGAPYPHDNYLHEDSYHEEGIDDYDSEYDYDDDSEYDDDDVDDAEFTDEPYDDYDEYAHSGGGGSAQQGGQPLSSRTRNLYPDRDGGGFRRSHNSTGSGRSYSGDGIPSTSTQGGTYPKIYSTIPISEFHARRGGGGGKIRHQSNAVPDRSARRGGQHDEVVYVDDYDRGSYEGYTGDSEDYDQQEGFSGERERGGREDGYVSRTHRRRRIQARGHEHLYNPTSGRGDPPSWRAYPDRAAAVEHEHRASLRSNDAARERDVLLYPPHRERRGPRDNRGDDTGGVGVGFYERRKRLDSSDSTSRPSSSVLSHPSHARRSDNSPHAASSVPSERASVPGGGTYKGGVSGGRTSNSSTNHKDGMGISGIIDRPSPPTHQQLGGVSRVTTLRDAPTSTSKESVKPGEENACRVSRSSNASSVTGGDRRLSGRPQPVPEHKEYLELNDDEGDDDGRRKICDIDVAGMGGRPHVPTPQQAPPPSPPHPSDSQVLSHQQRHRPPLLRGPSHEQRNSHTSSFESPRSDVQLFEGKSSAASSQQRRGRRIASLISDMQDNIMTQEMPQNTQQITTTPSVSAASQDAVYRSVRAEKSSLSSPQGADGGAYSGSRLLLPPDGYDREDSSVINNSTSSTPLPLMQGSPGQAKPTTSSSLALSESHITYFKRKPNNKSTTSTSAGLPQQQGRETGSTGVSMGTLIGMGGEDGRPSSRLSRDTAADGGGEGENGYNSMLQQTPHTSITYSGRERGRTTVQSFGVPLQMTSSLASRGRQRTEESFLTPPLSPPLSPHEYTPTTTKPAFTFTFSEERREINGHKGEERTPDRELLVRVSCGQTVYMVSTNEWASVAELKYQITVQHHISDFVLRSNNRVLEDEEELRRIDVTKLSIQPLA